MMTEEVMAKSSKRRLGSPGEPQLAPRVMKDHDHVRCAACGRILDGPHQATLHHTKGAGMWARQCSHCEVITWYDVEDEEENDEQESPGR